MYYAVKKVINSDPEALAKQYAEDYAALNADTQYAELIKEERKAPSFAITWPPHLNTTMPFRVIASLPVTANQTPRMQAFSS